MQNGIFVVGVEGRMKVEDGGKRGVTKPFWLRIVEQHGFPFAVSWRSIPQETTAAKQSATASMRVAQRAAEPAANDVQRSGQSKLMQHVRQVGWATLCSCPPYAGSRNTACNPSICSMSNFPFRSARLR